MPTWPPCWPGATTRRPRPSAKRWWVPTARRSRQAAPWRSGHWCAAGRVLDRRTRSTVPVGRHGIGHEAALVLVHVERPAHEGERALRAGLSLAHLAAGADGRRHLGVAQVHALGVDEPRRVADVAAKADRKSLVGR